MILMGLFQLIFNDSMICHMTLSYIFDVIYFEVNSFWSYFKIVLKYTVYVRKTRNSHIKFLCRLKIIEIVFASHPE